MFWCFLFHLVWDCSLRMRIDLKKKNQYWQYYLDSFSLQKSPRSEDMYFYFKGTVVSPRKVQTGTVLHTYNLSTHEAHAGGLWVWDQSWLHSETQSQNEKQKPTNQTKRSLILTVDNNSTNYCYSWDQAVWAWKSFVHWFAHLLITYSSNACPVSGSVLFSQNAWSNE
jgi:hypothetical protein